MATSCASPTGLSSTHGGRPGQDRFPPRPLLTPQDPPKWTLRALQHPDADDTPASALARRGWNDIEPRVSPHNATTAAPTGEHVVPEPRFPHGMRNAATTYTSSASTDVAAYEDLPGHHLLAVRNLIATTNDESYHPPPRMGTRNGTSPVCRTQ
jgi:hypothetical protein